MKYLRQKIWVVLLFTLISLGQGFALSYVFNLPKLNANEKIESLRAVPAHLLVCGHDFQKVLRENPKPHQKSHQEILSLRSDPFLPLVYSIPLPVMESFCLSFEYPVMQELVMVPPDKPPRHFS